MKIDVVESELNEAQTALEKFDNNVTIFGSSRIAQDDPLAKKAYQLGKALSDGG
ncbi:MAG TPA: TIGR00730 family Rossman fold protein, partial [Gammaproteobacteria bacterium]|nr:TIGR00730 family Rossman fold protein [Gammaproteobacteria bacterium]